MTLKSILSSKNPSAPGILRIYATSTCEISLLQHPYCSLRTASATVQPLWKDLVDSAAKAWKTKKTGAKIRSRGYLFEGPYAGASCSPSACHSNAGLPSSLSADPRTICWSSKSNTPAARPARLVDGWSVVPICREALGSLSDRPEVLSRKLGHFFGSTAFRRQGRCWQMGAGCSNDPQVCSNKNSRPRRRQSAWFGATCLSPQLGAPALSVPSSFEASGSKKPTAPGAQRGKDSTRNLSADQAGTGSADRPAPLRRGRQAPSAGQDQMRNEKNSRNGARVSAMRRLLSNLSDSSRAWPPQHHKRGRSHGRPNSRYAQKEPGRLKQTSTSSLDHRSNSNEVNHCLQQQVYQQNSLTQAQFVILKI